MILDLGNNYTHAVIGVELPLRIYVNLTLDFMRVRNYDFTIHAYPSHIALVFDIIKVHLIHRLTVEQDQVNNIRLHRALLLCV